MSTLLQDLRYGIRMLARNPGFTLVAVLTLALGIGANTAIFSAINALLLNPYPFPQPDRIVSVEAQHVSGKNSGTGYRDFLDWREQSVVFMEMAVAPEPLAFTLTGQGEPQHIIGGLTTYGFLRVLGIQPLMGRFFTAEEDKPQGAPVAVLTYAAWQRRFAGSQDILGRTMTLDDKPVTIIGVLPARFAFPGIRTCEFFASVHEGPGQGRYQHQYAVVARLKPGITVERAQADMSTITKRLEQEYPETNKGWGAKVLPIREALAQVVRKPVLILASSVGFVLLLACLNLAGLLLARASGRGREIAIRASLGATRGRIVRQMLTESVLLGLAGGSLGLVIAQWLMEVLRSAAPEEFALDATLGLNINVLLFSLAISIVTGIVFGMAPGLYASRTDLNTALKGDANAWSGRHSRNRVLSALVAGEIALSLVLLIGGGLLLKSFLVTLHVDTGLRIEHVLTFALDLPFSRYSTKARSTAFYQELFDRLRSSPGVDAAAGVMTLPMTGGMTGGGFAIEGRPKAADWVDTLVQYNISTPGYFRVMGIPLLRGRDFDEHDTANSLRVAIINDALARQFFPNEDPIGHRFKADYGGDVCTIIGIVGSIKHQKPMNPPVPGLYRPYTQWPDSFMWVTIRTSSDPAKIASGVQGVVRSFDRDLPIAKMRTMRQVVADSLSEPRLLSLFLAGFALFALSLAAIGLYGITAYSVSQRIHEMGIRFALGASYRDVLRLILRKGALLAALGIALGIPAALAMSQVMGSFLYGISPRDLTIFTAVPVLLLLVALSASYLPAHRAAKVDPVVALRYE